MRIKVTALILVIIIAASAFAAERPAKPPKDLSKYIAIFDFDVVGKVDKDVSRPLSDSMRHTIVKSGRFKVMDRANMDRILREQAFQMTGGVQKERAVEAGQFLGVGKIVIGSIGIVGRTYMISISLVNIESGETERVEEDTCKCEIDELIESVKRAANKLMEGGPELAPLQAAAPAPARRESLPPATVPVLSPSGNTYRDPATGMDFIYIKGGCFQMGDVFDDGNRDERPVHEVCVEDFYIGKYEVTQGQWKTIMGRNPSSNKKSDMHPVEDVSWNDTQDLIKELNQRSGRNFRLPFEAEWEYSARAGGLKQKWSGTDNEKIIDTYSWNRSNAGREDTHAVGQKLPNAFGLYDMTGNVSEWVFDYYDRSYYGESPRSNPNGPGRGHDRVHRGGSYDDSGSDLWTTHREKKSNRGNDSKIGFRLALPVR
jgi:sulfatase modifying factor 1